MNFKKTLFRISTLVALIIFSQQGFAQSPPDVLIFDTHSALVSTKGSSNSVKSILQFEVDGMSLAERFLSEGLPGNEAAAKLDVQTRLNGREAEISNLVGNSIRGIRLIEVLDIRYLPAVVINQEYVIYGVTSLDQALSIWRSEVR